MAGEQELPVQQKREVDKAQEPTTPMRAFLPTTDIFETDDALTVILEMPGADRDNIDVSVENGVLTVEGKINFKKYEGLQPVYSEYNVGPYRRSFRISSDRVQCWFDCGPGRSQRFTVEVATNADFFPIIPAQFSRRCFSTGNQVE